MPLKPWLKEIPCKALTKSGRPCTMPRMKDSDFCVNHNPDYIRKKLDSKPLGFDELRALNLTMVDAMKSDKYLGDQFPKGFASWIPWMSCIKSMFGLAESMTEREKKIYFECTGRSALPEKPFEEVFLVIGRRGGKSFISALVACYMAVFRDWSEYLRPGEIGYIPVIASDRDQARVVMNYVKAILSRGPLSGVLDKEPLKTQVFLKNDIVIEIRTASDTGIRGYTTVAAICDELAAWRASEQYANPSEEILEALRPTMDTVRGSVLIGISTPKARKGALWSAFKSFYSKNDPHTLVWRASTLVMNATFPPEKVERAVIRSPLSARAEYYAEFRADIETYLPLEAIEAVMVEGRKALLPNPQMRYKAFTDPTGGVGAGDSFTLAIGHTDKNKIVIDKMLEAQPSNQGLDLEATVQNFSIVLKSYGCYKVVGDKFGGNWCSKEFRKHGIVYIPTEEPYRTKSEIYSMFEPIVTTRSVEMPDDEKLKAQLNDLERQIRADGKDSITHPKGGHDDVANAAAGLASILFEGINIGLTPEYMVQRLPTVLGGAYGAPVSEYDRQKHRVLDKLRKEGVV